MPTSCLPPLEGPELAARSAELVNASHATTALVIGTGHKLEQYDGYWVQTFRSAGIEYFEYLEIHLPYVKMWNTVGPHTVTHGDVRLVDVVFEGRTFDVALWANGPEHVTANKMLDAIERLERVASRLVLLVAPWGGYYDASALPGNPHETHMQKGMMVESFDDLHADYFVETFGRRDGSDGSILVHRRLR